MANIDYSKYGVKPENVIHYDEYKKLNSSKKEPQDFAQRKFQNPDSKILAEGANSIGINKENPFVNIAQDFSGGVLQGAKDIYKNLPGSILSQWAEKVFPEGKNPFSAMSPIRNAINKFEPYQELGTENKSFLTPGGALQLASEISIPGAPFAGKIKKVKPTIKNTINSISPEKYANEFIEKLGLGSKNTTQNTKELANDLRTKFSERENQAAEFFNYVDKQAGKESIYKKPDPLITTEMNKYKSLIDQAKDFNIGDLYHEFKNKPNFKNAHQLQSEMGDWIRDLESKPHKSASERYEIKQLNNVRERLKNDIMDFLNTRDLNSNENLASAYKKGIDLYKEHVSPYLANKKIREIVKGGKTFIKNLHDVFQSPSNTINKSTGKEEIGYINKILQDLPKSSQNRLLYNAIGGKPKNANALLEKLNEIRNKGFADYFNPDIEESINALTKKSLNKKRLIGTGKFAGSILAPALGAGGAISILNKGSNVFENPYK